MRSRRFRFAANVLIGLLVAACASAASSAPTGSPATSPTPTPRPTAPPRAESPAISRLAAGGRHTCAVTDGDAVKCWGANDAGQLGDGTTIGQSTPVDVAGLASGVVAITAGGTHSCALTTAGGVKCWGSNGAGQLGNGTTTDSSIPVDVAGLASEVNFVAAGSAHTCAVTSGGAVRCWGANYFQQLGNGTTTDSSVPVPVSGLDGGVSAIAAGDIHSCALTTGGGVKCWGYAGSGGLGGAVPGDVPGLASGVGAISVSYEQSCALTMAGAVMCWGGATGLPPVDLFAGHDAEFSAISLGFGKACALSTAGAVRCWGGYDGSPPADVAGLASGITAIAAGGNHACAVTSSGAVMCWGDNWNGQLGNGRTCSTLASSSVPVDVDFAASSTSEPIGMPPGRIE
ncbi:MAG: regulator of chromosome condensation, partial [Chloroflexi bacterium]|nr:regulator of chromosome condensation [Chloroflexota bacterium]